MATVRTSRSLDALVPSWTRHVRAANLSPRTVQSYAEAARRLGVANWRPATAAVRYRSLQQLFRWLIDEGGSRLARWLGRDPRTAGCGSAGSTSGARISFR